MKLSKRQFAILALIIANIIWGAASPIFKWSMQEIPPYTFGTLRFLLAATIIFPFAYKKIAIKKADFPKLLALAAIGITINIALYFLGLQLTSSINVPILSALSPILTIVAAFWYLHEKLRKKIILGTLVSLIGIIVIIIQPLLITGPDGSIPGNLLIILSVLCGIAYTILLKKFSLPYSPITIVFWMFFLGGILFLPAFITELIVLHPFSYMDGKSLVGILYGAVFSSAIAYYLYNFSLNHLTISEVGIFIYLEPIITVLVAVPLLNEVIHPVYIIGSVIVFAGVFIAEAHLHHHHHLHVLRQKEHEKS